jgi:hypothetical protein
MRKVGLIIYPGYQSMAFVLTAPFGPWPRSGAMLRAGLCCPSRKVSSQNPELMLLQY